MKVVDRIATDYFLSGFVYSFGEAYAEAFDDVKLRFRRRWKRRLWWYPTSKLAKE